MGYGYEGEHLRLVPLDREKHLENCQRWMNDPEVTEWLAVGQYPLTMDEEKDWFDMVLKSNHQHIAFAIETLDGQHIGQSGLHNISLLHGFATTGSFIGDPNMRGKGYGTEAANIRSYYAFHVLGLRMLFSGYLGGNERSKRMQEKAGYELWGTQPKMLWKLGEYRDHCHTILTREKWLEMRGS